MIAYCGYTHGKMSVNRAATILGQVSLVIENWFGCGYTESKYWLPLLAKILATHSLPHLENEHQRSVNDFWSCILGNQNATSLQRVIKESLSTFIGKQIVIPSLPHLQNGRQRSINNFWSCILRILGGDRLQTDMNKVVAAFRGKRGSKMLPTPCWKWASTECQ